jgi:predicted branched-subunit amino acid permease
MAFGAISGVAMVAAGMPHYMAMLMSVMVYAGSSQLASLQLLASGTPLAVIILAGLVLNLRFSIYSLSISPHLAAAGRGWRPLPLRLGLLLAVAAGIVTGMLVEKLE